MITILRLSDFLT